MRKTVVLGAAALLIVALGAPAMAEEGSGGSSGPAVAAADQGAFVVAAKGKRRVRRAPKPGLEDTVRRIVDEAMAKRPMEWSYMAKRLRPPKSAKWQKRWNDLGNQGWELVGQNENVYIFKRSAHMASAAPMAPVSKEPKAEPKSGGGRYKQPKSEAPAAPSTGDTKTRGRQWR